MLASLTRHLLAVERDAWQALAVHADAKAAATIGLSATELGSALAVRSRAGGPLLNRAYDVPARLEPLLALRAHYEEAGVPLYFLNIEDAERAAEAIDGAGLVRYRRRMVYLARDLAGPSVRTQMPAGLTIGRATSGELLHAAEIWSAAFDADRMLALVVASMESVPGWHFLVARDGGIPIAVGVLYVRGELALLLGGATAPRFRERGAHAAIVAARVKLARELGARWIGGHTGEAVGDDPQHSFHNMVRAGLAPVGRLDCFAPPGIVWSHGRRVVGE